MSFKLLLADPDGGVPTVLMEVDDRRVERVGLATSRGECGAAKIDPGTTEVLISLEYAHVDGRPTIYDLEAMQHPTLQGNEVQRRMDVLQELPSGTNTGNDSILKGAEAAQATTEAEGQTEVEDEEEAEPTPPEPVEPVNDDRPESSDMELKL